METPDDLSALAARIAGQWARAGLGPCPPLRRVPGQDGSLHVEAQAGRFAIVATERGGELRREAGLTADAAARRILFAMACDQAQRAEARKLGAGGYSRWNWMAPDLEGYARARFAEVLRRHPLSDEERRHARWPLPGA